MTLKRIQDILPLVDKPSRYLGKEINTYNKNLSSVSMKMALAFPDLYEIGTSHFGLQILYHLLNQHDDIAAERVFAPAEDYEARLRSSGLTLTSLDSHHPLNQFDIIGFSLLYELNYTNVLGMLSLSGIPFLASERNDSHPIIIAGGPCASNPEPVADFFDAIVFGDGEQVLMKMAEIWLSLKRRGPVDKNELLQHWFQLPSVYVPSFYRVVVDNKGEHRREPIKKYTQNRQGSVKRAIVNHLDGSFFSSRPVVPWGKPIHDRLRLEVSRGCTRGCRFCQAGMIYRPVRERSPQELMDIAARCLVQTGYEDLSLLSLSTGDYTCIAQLIKSLMEEYASDHISVSLPSFRAGTLDRDVMQAIKKVRKTGFTIAPEAGTQRLRDVINKNVTTQEVITTVENAFSAGWRVIKLYFMVGLPTETKADLTGIVDLVQTLRKLKCPDNRYGKINVSVATFIPKPHTPFQWAPQLTLEESKARIEWLRSKLRLPGVQFKWQDPEVSILEGIMARGDRRLARAVINAYENGCRFDGWSDRFHFPTWQKSFRDAGIDMDVFMGVKWEISRPLPWDHMDSGVKKSFLIDEWNLAIKGTRTEDCRWGDCQQCGVCDFITLEPQLFENNIDYKKNNGKLIGPDMAEIIAKYKFVYSKQRGARFFGHLEMANIITRALRRAGLPMAYSKGFHPMPKISFDDPLPIGMEAIGEIFYLSVIKQLSCKEAVQKINQELPDGLKVKHCELVTNKNQKKRPTRDIYRVSLKEGEFDLKKLNDFKRMNQFTITLTNKKGRQKTLNLKESVFSIDLVEANSIKLTLKQPDGKRIRPALILAHVFDLPPDIIKQATIIKGAQHV